MANIPTLETEQEKKALEYKKLRYDIQSLLEQHNVPLELWGKGAVKDIDFLTKEVFNQEAQLLVVNEELFRKIRCVDVEIVHFQNGRVYRLIESKQVFKNGSERKRGYRGVSEKISQSENHIQGTQRALREELGLEENDIQSNIEIEHLEDNIELALSRSYPGLSTHYTVHKMRVLLSENEFNPEGYIEDNGNITTYFEWEEVEGKEYSLTN